MNTVGGGLLFILWLVAQRAQRNSHFYDLL